MTSKKIVSGVKALGASAFALAVTADLALAQSGLTGASPIPSQPTGVPFIFRDIETTIRTIFNVVIAAAGVIFILLFLIGGVQYLTAAGNEEATGKARRLIVDSIVGLVIILAAWAIGTWVLQALGVRTF